MFIERSASGYDRSGQQVTRRARFLILVSLGLERIEETCVRCNGTGKIGWEEDGLHGEKSCFNCIPIECLACERKGWTYDEKVDERAKTCEPCNGSGYLGPSGKQSRYVHHTEIRALVRKVAMSQRGHWMMGRARVFGHSLSLSGSYGGDGLTVTVPREIFDRAVPIPPELHEAWNKGGGHNSAGNEALAMRDWALANLDKLESTKRSKR
jgi:hypothetical protein